MSAEEDGFYESAGKRTSPDTRHDEHIFGKRRRLNEDNGHTNDTQVRISPTRLVHNDYTVAWICALSLEMTAARQMLDKEHLSLPNPPGDENTYVLGRISVHNVVITCLPAGHYGNNSAAEVAAHMMTTFRSVSYPLLVGIGGGVPQTSHDIRLGDVVVSMPTPDHAAVVQYDYGKTTANGVFEHKGSLNNPKISLLKTLSNLKSRHDLRATRHNQIPTYMAKALEGLDPAKFAYPGAEEDILYENEYDHVLEDTSHHQCEPLKPKHRLPRQNDGPQVHYGTIASGNKVIKDTKTRNELARKHGALCFEMEAAALMNSLSCLVIRGICDYCDSKKNKQFQGYAALTAAAYAKEFISCLPEIQQPFPAIQSPPISKELEERRRIILQALDFEAADSRRATVRRALSNTCKWFLDKDQYRNWIDTTKFEQHHGLLWIKGKAGSGKSTLVKFLFEETQKLQPSDCIIISFFFNARGHALERSTLGMYRSLLHQLLSQMPELQILFDRVNISQGFDGWQLGFLKSRFEQILKMLKPRTLICFIDALDECPEDQIRDMVGLFEELGNLATDQTIMFRVCFSSRHYPNIIANVREELILEHEPGHSHDIEHYISKNITGRTNLQKALREEIQQKAGGVFLWVVLVVQILKQDYARGEIDQMRARIKSIPQELDNLFRDILTRDTKERPKLLLCIQWVMYSMRPLRREEFYFAMRSGEDEFNNGYWDPEKIDIHLMENFMLTSSKGLVELTRGKTPTVQFIHESVREFLKKPDALLNFWPTLESISEGHSHNRLRNCCYRQVLACEAISLGFDEKGRKVNTANTVKAREKARRLYPFLDYATNHVLYHADHASASGEPQSGFLDGFDIHRWAKLCNGMQTRLKHRKERLVDIHAALIFGDHFAALKDFWQAHPLDRARLLVLLKASLESNDIEKIRNILTLHYSHAESAATSETGHVNTIFEIIVAITTQGSGHRHLWLLELLLDWNEIRDSGHLDRLLHLAALYKMKSAVHLSLKAGAHIDRTVDILLYNDGLPLWRIAEECTFYHKPSWETRPLLYNVSQTSEEPDQQQNMQNISIQKQASKASVLKNDSSNAISCISLMLDYGASMDHFNTAGSSVWKEASKWADATFLQFLLDHGLRVSSDDGPASLRQAVVSENLDALEFWLDRRVSVKEQGGHTLLHCASTEHIAKILIDHGALLDTKNGSDDTPLHVAVHFNRLDVARLLLSRLANPNIQNNKEQTPLYSAVSADMVNLLAQHEAKIDVADSSGRSPLHMAVGRRNEAVVGALLYHGANINFLDGRGRTPLYFAGSPKMVNLLIQQGAEIDAVDTNGRSPLHMAAECWQKSAVKALLCHGADVNFLDFDGRSPLQLAETSEVHDLLIENGAKTGTVDSKGQSQLHMVIDDYEEANVRLFIRHGVDVCFSL